MADVFAELGDASGGVHLVRGSRFAKTTRAGGLPIACEYVIGQRHERIPLATWWECGKTALRAVRVFDGTLVREASDAVLAEQREDVAPLIGRYRALLHDRANQTIGLLAAALQKEDDRQCHFPFPQITANGLPERRLVGRVVEQIVDELECNAEVETVV